MIENSLIENVEWNRRSNFKTSSVKREISRVLFLFAATRLSIEKDTLAKCSFTRMYEPFK